MDDRHHNRGITLLELMVVISLITILLALLIPAVQHARVSAAHVRCLSRMRQLGMALHNHQSTFEEFPSFVDRKFNWQVALLPFLELSNLHARLDFDDLMDGVWWEAPNDEIALMSIEAFCCPADPSRREGVLNYVGNAGTGFAQWNGFFAYDRLRPRDILDGMSNTAAVSECKGGESDQPFEFITSGKTDRLPDWKQFVSDCKASGPIKWPPNNFMGRGWLTGGYPTTNYAHILTPGSNSCKPQGDGLRYSVATARSHHTGGVNVVLADGSVKFESNQVDGLVWRKLGSVDSSEFPLED